MRISIVTISFNQAQFLEEAICSVLDQDYHDVEYIVVDPGSTDGSREIIEKYRSRISKVILDSDFGPADGLNKGFAVATGEIFGFLNSDDVLEKGALSSVVYYFDKFPLIDVISGNTFIVDSNGHLIRRFFSDRYSIWMAAHHAAILSQASTFFRSKSYLNAGGFNIKNRIAWDGELYLDMALSGARFACATEFWSKFRIHQEGITGSGKLDNLYSDYYDHIFTKVMGRSPTKLDRALTFLARFIRKIKNPSDTKERLFYGPIYRASST
ncbi:glycosyltransferase family 2 protein [Polynucleobacter sp. JS-JIR-II-b4]|uniref:glycosyltransferase family 2 protein n=1 Tax=Polynucleobacter sp. JS-JIR-II-b4 TaxID=1758390 RepID=UPI001BFE4C93|nr:glycosyltransferase family 2 protein [Polynucleobacter sp. JS-JIR-II-b4]QWE02848.1 glycosyltransferase [Polynucleobacter sp. JS-JIR-II-b4]